MTLAAFRDLVLSIAGLVFIGVVILYAVLGYRFYHRVKPMLALMEAASETLQGFAACASGVFSMIRGLNLGANIASNLFRKKGGKQK